MKFVTVLNHLIEGFPIFQAFHQPVIFQIPSTVFVPPTLGGLCNVDDFEVLFPDIVDYTSKLVDNTVQAGNIRQVGHIEVSNRSSNLFDKEYFLLAIFDDRAFGSINTLFNDGNGDGKRSIVQCQLPIQINKVVVKFT